MKLADLQLAMELQHALANLDHWPAGEAQLIDAMTGDQLHRLSPDELAAFVDWRRRELHKQLRKLGVEPDGAAPAESHNEAVRQQKEGEPSAVAANAIPGDPSPPRRLVVKKAAKPPVRMTRAQALAEARRRILDPFEKELRANGGYLADPEAIAQDLAIYHDKRRADIAQLATELMRGPQVKSCVVCGDPATTVKAGQDYCTKDARAVQVELPEAVRLVA